MNEQQIIEKLAANVMEWELGRHGDEMFWFERGLLIVEKSKWDPLQNAADAMQLLDALGEVHDKTGIYSLNDEKWCEIENFPVAGESEGLFYKANAETFQKAICLVAGWAIGIEESDLLALKG